MNLKGYFQEIANAIHQNADDSRTPIKGSDFPQAIKAACNHQASNGYENGLKVGKDDAYNEFWDEYQNKGNREHYSYAFGGKGWTDKTFKPKYDIILGSTVGTCLFAYSKITDLVDILERQGVVLDTSQSTDLGSIFNTCSNLINAPLVDASNAKHCGSIFFNCTKLESAKLKLKDDGSQTFSSAFSYCNNLYDFEIVGGLIGQDINFKNSPLSQASLLSVINALASDVTGKTLTISNKISHLLSYTTVKNAIAKKPNWTISVV